MDVREVRSVAEWDNLAGEWQRIVDESPRATVFQTWEWMRTWWDHFGHGKRLRILVFVDGGTIRGFAPLFFPPAAVLLRTARLVGTGGTDYLDIIASPGAEREATSALLRYLAENQRAWAWVDLQQIRPDAAFDPPHSPTPVVVEEWPGETCPFLALPRDWETFRKGLGKKLRGNIGYYERALEKLYQVDMRLATGETLRDDLALFFDLHQKRWNRRWLPGAFASRRARAFHESVALRLQAQGWLRLHTLALDNTVQAALYCFQFKNRCSYYLSGFEPTLARLSIGTVLTARAIRHAIEADGADEFDLLRGDEPYKYRWGARDRYNRRISISRGGVRSAGLRAAGKLLLQGELAMKARMHRKHGSPPVQGAAKTAAESASIPPGAGKE